MQPLYGLSAETGNMLADKTEKESARRCDSPRVQEADAAAQLLLDGTQLPQALLHLPVQLHGACQPNQAQMHSCC